MAPYAMRVKETRDGHEMQRVDLALQAFCDKCDRETDEFVLCRYCEAVLCNECALETEWLERCCIGCLTRHIGELRQKVASEHARAARAEVRYRSILNLSTLLMIVVAAMALAWVVRVII